MNIAITENGQTTITEAHVVETSEDLDALFAAYGFDGDVADEELDADDLPSSVFDIRTHNGWITIENTATGAHRTFQVKTAKFGALDSSTKKRVVSLLVGPDREDYTAWKGFGFVTDDGISVWKKCRGESGKTSDFEKFAALLEDVVKGENSGLNYMLEGRCRCCNRRLTVPESVRSGIGPICAGK